MKWRCNGLNWRRRMSFCSQEEEFFDTREYVTSVSDSESDCLEGLRSSQYDIWMKNFDSVQERRHKFFERLGVKLDRVKRDDDDVDSEDSSWIECSMEIDRIVEDSGAVLANDSGAVVANPDSADDVSSMSSWSSNEIHDSSEDIVSEVNFLSRIKNVDNGAALIVDQLGQDNMLTKLDEVGSNQLVSSEEFQTTVGVASVVQQFTSRETNAAELTNNDKVVKKKRVKKGWLRRLGAFTCVGDPEETSDIEDHRDYLVNVRTKVQRVRVRQRKKHSKEISALFKGQEIQAHKGSILTMKFSPDGQYLASAGEDQIVRVWQVMECERSNDIDISELGPSSMYFTVNHSSELAALSVHKGCNYKFKSLRKASDSACVIFPSKVFRLSEKPIHEFCGHSGDILDISWSKDKSLLSSSVDKTVRLWKVGFDQCLRVFRHNNYVTCVQFNPVDDNYFISGSIDGKVRIWNVTGCRVVDWTSIREIVTAVCYQPDGQGGIVGSMSGTCRFYDSSDNHLQLEAQICLQGKKKSPGKRITGFQFSPTDPNKLMVTSADSQVRILDGVDVIHKYKGLRNPGSQISASFTIDGKHIISASEDSNVYVWNYDSPNGSVPSKTKNIWSSERFLSSNVSVAVPWSGMRPRNNVVTRLTTTPTTRPSDYSLGAPLARIQEIEWKLGHLNKNWPDNIPFSPPDCFSLHNGFFSEALPKGTATWPEEKLPTSSSLPLSPTMCKSQYRFLKSSCKNAFTSPHAWGMVIVTASFDGRIRSFLNYGLPIP